VKYKAVIFDLFGTLVDNFKTSEYLQVLADMSAVLYTPAPGFSKLWRETFYLRTDGTHKTHEESIRYICRELGTKVSEQQIDQAAVIRLGYSIKTLKPRADTIPTIKKIKEMGYKVGMISDCSPETPKAWPMTPFKGIFDVTVFSCEAGVKKPDPRIYHIACGQLGVKPEDCLYVGDGSSTELTGALKTGMHPVQILDPGENADTHYVDRETGWEGPKISYLNEVLNLL
jgi:putative hydrolase of the HAD superfamily